MTAGPDPRARFSATVGTYARCRPSYPAAALEWLEAATAVRPPAPVLDLGCGTGILSRLLAARGFAVTGVDPNPDMLAQAEAAGGGPRYARGEAAATGQSPGTAALAVAGQAFHWFELDPTFRELRRVLQAWGWAAALWNVRAQTPFLQEYEALLRAHCASYAEVPRPGPTLAALRAHADVRNWTEAEFPSRQSFDRQGFHDRAASSSYVAHGVSDRPAFAAALDALFAAHARDGCISFDYRTLAAAWRLA